MVTRLLLTSALMLLAVGSASPADSPRRPNIIFILADDLGWGDLHCYGSRDAKTPNLDRLAEQGTLFTQFYTAGSVCSPSRCGFFTGQVPARHKVHGHFATHEMNERRGMANWLDPKTVNLARLLKGAGYATVHVGKWHLGSGDGAPSPKEYGFDFVRATTSNDDTWTERNEDPFFRAKSTGLFVDEAVKFIEANKDRPFYLQLWTLVPHATLNPTAEQLKPYANIGPGGKAFPHKSAKQIFYASVTDLDTQIGRLLAKLDELKLTGNTLVVFSSDNGPEEIAIRNAGHSGVGSSGPFRGRKRSLYEGGIRVPFIVRYPGVVTPRHVDNSSVISGTDFLPTICSFAGIELPEDYRGDGEDRSGAIRANDKPAPRTKPLYWEWRFNIAGHVLNKSPVLAVRDGKWKLLFNPDRSRVELYDIPADPSELHNLAEKHPDIVERLAKYSLEWQATLPKGPFDAAAGKNDYPWPKEKP